MHLVLRASAARAVRRRALGAALFACVGLGGCDARDPLEVIRQQQAAGRFQDTVEPLRELLSLRPDDPEVNFRYGRALSFTQPHMATWALRKAMEDPAWLVPAGLQLAYLALASSDFDGVYQITGQILESEPENTQALLLRASAHAHSRRDYELATIDAKRILELDPDMLEAYEPLIMGLIGLGRLDEAGEALAEAGRRLVELGGQEQVVAWHCATTAVLEQQRGALEKARETWIRCLEAHPTDPDVVSSAMGFYDAQREPQRSLEVARGALAQDPSSPLFRSMLAQRLHASGDTAGAEAVLLEATRSETPIWAAGAWRELAKFRQGLGEWAAAAEAMEHAVEWMEEAGEPNRQLLFEYADALVLAGQLERALEVAEELPLPAHRNLIRGRVAQERRDPALALEEFEEAFRLWPDNPWARYYGALAAEELGDFERALDGFRNAVRIEPGATDARTRGAALLLADGNPRNALVMLETGSEPPEIEGQLLAMYLTGLMDDRVAVARYFAGIEASQPGWAGQALAEAAEGLAQRAGPALAADMLAKAPGVDFGDPRFAPALRALVRFSHEAKVSDSARAAFETIFAARPDSSAFQEVRAFDLELSGAPADAVRAAYLRALELDAENALAMAGLGRLALPDDPAAALDFFERAAAADPSEPDPKLQAAKALIASGELAEAAERLDALLLEHPYEVEAAAERARLDLERGIATEQTLERAKRAARFGGGADALELLSRVHTLREEPELAAKAEAARDRLLAKASGEQP